MPGSRVASIYLFVVLLWSTTPLAIQWSIETMSPATSVTLRMFLSLAIILLAAPALGVSGLDIRRHWKLYLASAFGICPSMPLVYLAAQQVPSGLISVVFGLSPFLVGLLSGVIAGERSMTAGRYLALFVALSGLIWIFIDSLAEGVSGLVGLLLLLAGMASFAVSGPLVKRYVSDVSPPPQLLGSLLFASVMLMCWWLAFDRSLPGTFTARSFWSLVYLAVIGSVLGFMGYFYLIRRISVNLVALIPLITPALALWWGFLFNDESLTPHLLGGSALILLGLGLFNHFRPRRPHRLVPEH